MDGQAGHKESTIYEGTPYDEIRGCSSVGRAPALQAGGREFESLILHSTLKTEYRNDKKKIFFMSAKIENQNSNIKN